MKLEEIDRLSLQNIFLKTQSLLDRSPYFSEIVRCKQKEVELLEIVCKKIGRDIQELKDGKIFIDYETGEVTETNQKPEQAAKEQLK